MARPACLLILLAVAPVALAGPVNNDLLDVVDSGLVTPQSKDLSRPGPSLGARYINLVSSVSSWLGSVGWNVYGTYNHFLTLPDKSLPVYFNGSSTVVHAVVGNIAALGAAAYLLSFLPSAGGYSKYGDDVYGYEDEALGYGLARDQDDGYDFDSEDGEYDYQYPDSVGDWDYAASEVSKVEAKRRRVKEDRMGGGARRPVSRRRQLSQRRRGPGLVERFRDSVSSLFSSPVVAMERMGEAVYDPAGFLKEFAKRYDSYWQRRRGGPGARGRGRPQYRSAEGAELVEDTVEEQALPQGEQGEQGQAQGMGLYGRQVVPGAH